MALADDSGGAWSPAPSTYDPSYHKTTRQYYDEVTGATMAVDYDIFGGQSRPYVVSPGGRNTSFEDDYIRTRTVNGVLQAYDIRDGSPLWELPGGSGSGGGGGGGGSVGPQAEQLRELNGNYYWVNNYTQTWRPADIPGGGPNYSTYSNDGRIVAIDPTGQVGWEYQFPEQPRIFSNDGRVVNLGPDGRPIWEYQFPGSDEPQWDFRTINGQTAYFDPTDPAGGYNILRPAQGSLYGGTVGGQAASLLYGNAPASNPYAAYGTRAPQISVGTGGGGGGGSSRSSSSGFDPSKTIIENQLALEALKAKNAANISYQSQLAGLRANQPMTAYERFQMELQQQRMQQEAEQFAAQQQLRERDQRLGLANQFQSAVTATDPQALAAFLASYGTIGSGIAQGGTALSDAAILPAAATLAEGEGLQGFAEGTRPESEPLTRNAEATVYGRGEAGMPTAAAQAPAPVEATPTPAAPPTFEDWWAGLQQRAGGPSYVNPLTGQRETYRYAPDGSTIGQNRQGSASSYYYQNVAPPEQNPTVAMSPEAQQRYMQAYTNMQQRVYGPNNQFNAAGLGQLTDEERFLYEYLNRNKYTPGGTQYLPQDAIASYFNSLIDVDRAQGQYNAARTASITKADRQAMAAGREANKRSGQATDAAIAQAYGAPAWSPFGGDNSQFMGAQRQYTADLLADQKAYEDAVAGGEHYGTPVDPRSMTREQRIAAGDHPIFRDTRRPGFIDYMGNPFAPGGGPNLMAEYNVIRNNPSAPGVQGWRAGIPNPYAPPGAVGAAPGQVPPPVASPAGAGGAPGSGLQLLTAFQPTTMTGNEYLWENGQYVRAAPGKVIPPGTPYWTTGPIQGFAGGTMKRETPTDEPFVVGEPQVPGVPNPELMIPKGDGTFEVVPFNKIPGLAPQASGMQGFATGTEWMDIWGTPIDRRTGQSITATPYTAPAQQQQPAQQQPVATQPATQPATTTTTTPGYTPPAQTLPGYTPPRTAPAPQPQQPGPAPAPAPAPAPTSPAPTPTAGPGSSLAQWLTSQGYNLTGDIEIPDYLQGYADQVRDIRENVNYPGLNPMDVSFSMVDPVVRDLYQRGIRSQYGIPLESQQFEQWKYALPGVGAGAFAMRY